jgi:multidrug efflux system membrane fusion protein
MRLSFVISAGLAVAAVAWIASGQLGDWKSEPERKKSSAEISGEKQLTLVRARTQTAERRRTDLLINGQTEAVRTVDLKAELDGAIDRLPVEKGVRVAAGDVIAHIAARERLAGLAEAKAIMQQRRIEYEAAVKLADRGYRAETSLAEARAAFEAAKAGVELAQVEVDNLTIEAPFAGVLKERMVELGGYLKAGDEVARIVELDPILFIAQVGEQDVGKLSLGDPGTARMIGHPGVEGRIRFIAATADAQTRTFRVELEVPNPQFSIPVGVTAEIALPLGAVAAHKISPAILTLDDAGRVGVNTLDPESRVRFRPVTIIEDEADGVWVAGLPETVTLVIVGQEFVIEGEEVRVQAEEAATAQAASAPRDLGTAQ